MSEALVRLRYFVVVCLISKLFVCVIIIVIIIILFMHSCIL